MFKLADHVGTRRPAAAIVAAPRPSVRAASKPVAAPAAPAVAAPAKAKAPSAPKKLTTSSQTSGDEWEEF